MDELKNEEIKAPVKQPKMQLEGMHNIIAVYDVPEEIKIAHRQGFRPFGSLNKVKVALFIKDQNFNEIYDYYLQFKPQRQQEEGYEDYKNRMKFQKTLHKYKSDFFDYSVYPERNKPWKKKFVKEMFDLETI